MFIIHFIVVRLDARSPSLFCAVDATWLPPLELQLVKNHHPLTHSPISTNLQNNTILAMSRNMNGTRQVSYGSSQGTTVRAGSSLSDRFVSSPPRTPFFDTYAKHIVLLSQKDLHPFPRPASKSMLRNRFDRPRLPVTTNKAKTGDYLRLNAHQMHLSTVRQEAASLNATDQAGKAHM